MLDIKKELESFDMKSIEIEEENDVSIDIEKEIKDTKRIAQMISMQVKESKKDDEIKTNRIKALERDVIILDKEKIKMCKKIVKFLDRFEDIMNYAKRVGSEKLSKNLELIEKGIQQDLREINIEEIPGVGEQFDARLHEAVGGREDKSKMKYEIVEVLEKGYKFNGKILRVAKVIAVE